MKFARMLPVLGLLLTLAAVQDEEKVKLEVKFKKGDKVTVKETSKNEGTMTMTVGGEDQEMEMTEDTVFEKKDEVLAVDENGWPTRTKRTITRWTKTEKGPMDEEEQESTKTLEGKTITIERDGKESTVKDAPEDTPEEELKKNDIRRPVFVAELPDKPVAVGESWDLTEKGLKEEFAKDMDGDVTVVSAKGKGTLKKITKGDAKVAEIEYDLTIEGEMQDGAVKLTFKMKMKAKIDLGASRILSISGGGPVTMKGTMDQGGQEIDVKGEFNITGKTTYSWE